MDEPPISLYPSLAKRTGVNKAAILQEVHFLCLLRKQDQSQFWFHDGKWWVYNTYEQWRDKYLSWLNVGTVKRLFLELEWVGILLSHPFDRDQCTKWYTINSEAWDDWFNASVDEEKKRLKTYRKNGTKCDEKASQNVTQKTAQNDPVLPKTVTKDDVSPIDKESEDSLSEDSLPEDSSTTERAGEVVTSCAPPADGDDELQHLILPEVRKLHLPPDDQQTLLALGYAQALAIAWAARKGHNPGGLAKHLMASGGAPDELVARAQIAIAHQTLDAQAIDRELNTRQLADLTDAVNQITAVRSPLQEPPTPATSGGIPESVLQRFDAALKTLLHPLAGEWVYGAQAIRYERDVLAIAVTGVDEKTALMAFRRALGDDAPFHVELKVVEEVQA
jgi:hypothetical protein